MTVRDHLLHPPADFGMKQLLEDAPALRVAEDELPQLSSIQPAGIIQHLAPELLHDFLQRATSRFDHLARDHVRIDYRHAEFFETSGRSGFAAGNSAGEADDQLFSLRAA